LPGFLDGLAKVGFVEGRNVAIEYRYAEGHYERLSPLTIELLARRVTAIFAASNPAAQAAKPASPLIPVVFAIGGDPVDLGLVASLNRPGGNITGVTFLSTTLVAKSLEILHEVATDTGVVAAIVNPTNPDTAPNISALREAARNLRLQLHILNVSSDSDIDTAFDALVQRQVGALLIDGDPLFGSHINHFVAQLARHPLPAIYQRRLFPDTGGLMSFGASNIDAYRIAGDYVGRILKGEKPADLPVQQSTKAELVINLKTAKVLGLTVPLTLRVRADEAIE
jgi:putative ABC transport system substrate-binding protein